MDRWEYQVVNTLFSEEELNALGAEGWELVAALRSEVRGQGATSRMYFKRLLAEGNWREVATHRERMN